MPSESGADYIAVLDAITSSHLLPEGDFGALAREITQRVSQACDVERVSVWLFNDDETLLTSADLYCASARSHSSGLVLRQEQFASEFQALKDSSYLAAEEPLADPRLRAYAEEYLKPNGITSMLDVLVSYSKRHFGLLCLEHVGRPHSWQRREIEFAGQIAEKIAIAVATQRMHQAERALRMSEARFRTIFDRAPVGISLTSPSARYLRVNERFCEITGYAAAELCKRDFRDITHPDDIGKDEANLRALLTRQTSSYATEKRYIRSDGTPIWVALFVTPVWTASGEVDYLLTIVQEITERIAAERRLRESTEKLRRSNRAQQVLSAGNEALMRARDEPNLLWQMTRLLNEVGGYPVAFVGYSTPHAYGCVEPRACVGVPAQQLASSPLCWADRDRNESLVGTAIRLGQTQLIRDVATRGDPSLRETLSSAGDISAVLILPLQPAPAERPFGAICIAAGSADALDPEEVKLLEQLASNLGYGISHLRTAIASRNSTDRLRRGLEATIEAIAATMDARDAYTAGHQRRVAELSTAIAREMRLPSHTIEGIHLGALIHDIGKLHVPSELLVAPRRLTAIELELIKTHARAGHDIVKGIEFEWPIAQMVLQHHERLDGSGYPQGLHSDEIILEARIIAVADVVEAMASHRPYRPALGVDAALAEIGKHRGHRFDAQVVDACVQIFRQGAFRFTHVLVE